VAAREDNAEFTFSWLALQLLGRGLYSNPWSALSELVANGLDAGATAVHVHIDARDKANATVEVIDNGSGMSRADIATYVKVGHNKRRDPNPSDITNGRPKGRKGIGKLAALFLSPHFFLSTKHRDGHSSWELDAREGMVQDDEHPQLLSVTDVPQIDNLQIWDSIETGTRLVILGVDLNGFGTQALSALNTRLANQFLLPENANPRIMLRVVTSNASPPLEYAQVQKSVAFGNLASVIEAFPDPAFKPADLNSTLGPLRIPAPGLVGKFYEHTPTRRPLTVENDQHDEAWAEIDDEVDRAASTYNGIQYQLTGWIGVHATIDNDAAKANDERFTKNRYYNPAQIRVYVRGKLASDRLLSQLGLTGTYANYIEGEITFDILDDDDLRDIATSNRQDFDETDKRVTLLRALVRPLVRKLIEDRTELASTITALSKVEKERRDSAGKQAFTQQLRADLDSHAEIPQSSRDELHLVITNKIQGEVTPKQSFRLFISHSRADAPFAIFIDELLRSHGARKDEIFFTSRMGATEVLLDDRALNEVVKRNITDDNTLIFYLTSKNFLASQYCLFEGGAGWATRSVSEYLKLNLDYSSIPKWLTNGKGEALLLADNTIELTPDLHNYLVDGILNPMVRHLNLGRDISGSDRVTEFRSAEYPISTEMRAAGKQPSDYFDRDISDMWQSGIADGISDYLRDYLAPPLAEQRIAELEAELSNLKSENKNGESAS